MLFRIGSVRAILQTVADTGCTEVGTTHGAVVALHVIGSLVVFQRPLRVEREVELILPSEVVARLGQGVVANRSTGMTLGQVGRMGSNLVSDDTYAYIFLVGQSQMFFRGDIT